MAALVTGVQDATNYDILYEVHDSDDEVHSKSLDTLTPSMWLRLLGSPTIEKEIFHVKSRSMPRSRSRRPYHDHNTQTQPYRKRKGAISTTRRDFELPIVSQGNRQDDSGPVIWKGDQGPTDKGVPERAPEFGRGTEQQLGNFAMEHGQSGRFSSASHTHPPSVPTGITAQYSSQIRILLHHLPRAHRSQLGINLLR